VHARRQSAPIDASAFALENSAGVAANVLDYAKAAER
jgi:hypothetical protein